LLNERFGNVSEIVAQGATQYSEGEAAEELIANMKVEVPAQPPVGLGYRITIAGTRATGTNGTFTVTIKLAGTAVLTLQADANASGDWVCEATIMIVNANVQKCWGILHQTTQDPKVDYAGGTVNLTNGGFITASMTQGNASDASTVEMWHVDKWVQELS